jgi:hypothetical protein
MQLPAKPKGCRGCVTATKHIGLDSFRVRNCEPGTNHRRRINRASRCWNEDFEFGCIRQPSGPCAPSRLFVALHDSDRRTPFVAGVEFPMGSTSVANASTRDRGLTRRGPAHDRRFNRSSPFLKADSSPAVIDRAVSPFGLVRASGRIAPFFVLFRPFFSASVLSDALPHADGGPNGFHQTIRSVVATTCSQSGPRTHSLIRVSNEKRNADERPPTRGKSDRHR